MKLETFFEKFDQFADAPDAVAKMRELVLELAIQGKLVAQVPKEGNALDLVKEIDRLREGLKTDGEKRRIPKVSLLPQPGSGIQLPPSWVAVRLGRLCSLLTQGPNPKYRGTPQPCFRVLKTKDFYDHVIHYERTDEVSDEVFNEHLQSELIRGDIVYGLVGKGSTAKCNVFEPQVGMRFIITRATGLIRLVDPDLVLPLYVKCFFASVTGKKISEKITDGSTGQVVIRTSELKEIVLPLPPLAEQKRIVAKVNELMALCDRLEAQHQERETRRASLARASLARFADAPTPANLPFLFHQTYDIPPTELRKSILNLAVQGRLLPQDPNDEPAEELIDRIAEIRHERIAKQYLPVTEGEAPYEIPRSWKWVRLGNISLTSDSGWSPQCLPEPRSGSDWGVLKVSSVSWGVFKPEENKALPPGMPSRPACEVKPGDFLISRANTADLVARSVVVYQTPPGLMMSDKIVRFAFPDEIDKAFVNLANMSCYSRSYYALNASGTSSSMKNVGRGVMCNLPIPLPPLAEQRRIVSKVEQLSALIIKLELQLADSQSSAANLLAAVVAELTAKD